tara:strand:+ start:3376 stop:4407 length:1032 start_codon:yes stop_codon:yes gene_type:complete
MMNSHYEIIHYGHEDSDVICSEHVTVTTNETLKESYGTYDWKKEFFKHDTGDHAHQVFHHKTKHEMEKRVEKGDAILCFWGYGHQPTASHFGDKTFVIEPGIGYNAGGVFAPYKVFESYAVMHAIYGDMKKAHPSWYDSVIPNYFDLDDFEYSDDKEDYYLYLGRITEIKGINIIIDAMRRTGKTLLMAGQGDLKDLGYDELPPNVVDVGFADVEKRKKLLKKAKALILPTYYIEPFGGVTVEAMLSGTPIITSDWGCFAENNLHGVTGYRCRNMDHFVWAIENIDKIKNEDCRQWAEKNFSLDRVSKMYKEYFNSIENLNGEGFYHTDKERQELDWLKRFYP